MRGDKVKHRADSTGREMIVISETVVAAAWIEDGQAFSDYFEPEELEVVEAGEKLRGVGFDSAWIAGDADPPPAEGIGQCVECEKPFLVRPDPFYGTFECPLCGASYQVDSRHETGYRHIPPLGLRQTALAAAGWNELGPLCKRCSKAPTGGNPCTESRGAEKVIGVQGVRRCAAFDLADVEIDPCSSCAHHHPDENIMCASSEEPTIVDGKCDRFVTPSSKVPDDPKPSDADLADAIDNALCLACDHWPNRQEEEGLFRCSGGRMSAGSEDTCGGGWVRTEPPPEDQDPPHRTADASDWLDHGPSFAGLAAEELAAELTRRGMVVVAPAELPEPHCYNCDHWDVDAVDPCQEGIGSHDDGAPCDEHRPRWEDIAKHLSKQVAGGELLENPHIDAGVRRELDGAAQPENGPIRIAFGGPRPTNDLDSAPFAEQLDWLRASGYPVPVKTGRQDRTSRLLRAIRAGIWTNEHSELLFGPLKWPEKEEPAKCPECGSETPEDCGCELP